MPLGAEADAVDFGGLPSLATRTIAVVRLPLAPRLLPHVIEPAFAVGVQVVSEFVIVWADGAIIAEAFVIVGFSVVVEIRKAVI